MAQLNIEVMHLYAHELMRPRTARSAAAAAYGFVFKKGVIDSAVCALVDEYNSELHVSREEAAESLIWYAAQEEVTVNFVAFESDCAIEADRLLEQAGIPEADVNGDRHFRRVTEQSSTAVLVSADEYVACPTLAAVWMLARLGVPNFEIPLYSDEGRVDFDPEERRRFVGERLQTLLPLKYIRTESTVYELLRATPHNITGKIGYAFY